MKNKGPLYVLTCYVIWGLLPIFWKLLAQVDSLYVLASRIVWSMVLTGGILLLRRGHGRGAGSPPESEASAAEYEKNVNE